MGWGGKRREIIEKEKKSILSLPETKFEGVEFFASAKKCHELTALGLIHQLH